MMRQTQLTIQGIRTPCLIRGKERTEAVLFLHGNPGSGKDWETFLPSLSDFTYVVAPDMPGFGRAEKPDNFNYSIDGYQNHTELLLDKLKIEKVHLVLHDFGGAWGLAWATEHPHRVASITLINVGLLRNYRWHFFARLWRMPVVGELVMRIPNRLVFRTGLKIGNPRGLPKTYIDELINNFDRETKRAVLRLYRATDVQKINKELVDRTISSLLPLDIDCLVIWGKHDVYVPSKYAAAQKEAFPNAEIIYFEDSGHWPFIDNPGRFNEVLVGFLKKVVSK